MNGLTVCLDEIALEGLDGITLSTLWKRLDHATPRLLSTLDKPYKTFLWNSIRSQDVQTFLLKEPRELLDTFAEDDKVYPFFLIDSQESGGIRGSCSTYSSRELVDVSKDSLDVVEERYGHRLVLVASQVMRDRVLFHSEVDTFSDVSDGSYCILEWIGRARKLGRLQSCPPVGTGIDVKNVFHYIKVLHQMQAITKKAVYMGRCKTCVLYLQRFHVEHVNDNLASSICNIMEKRAGKSVSFDELCTTLCVSPQAITKSLSLLSERGHIISSTDTNYLPGSEDEEITLPSANNFKLIRPFYNRLCGEDDKNDDDNGDDEGEDIYISGNNDFLLNIPAEIPILNHIYQLIVSRGVRGITRAECFGLSNLPWYDLRTVLKQLENSQNVTIIIEDAGRQRIHRLIATNIFKEHQNLSKLPLVKENELTEPISSQIGFMETESNANKVEECTSNSLTDSINILETTKKEHQKSLGFTERLQKRRKLVTDFLAQHKVVVGEFTLRKFIVEKEAESGLIGKMDKRTFPRFLQKLKENGTIQVFEIDLHLEGKNTLKLICDIKMKRDSPEVLAHVNKHKKKMMAEHAVKEALSKSNTSQKELIKRNAKLGYLPKMPRAEMLHIFLYVMIYELVKPDIDIHSLRQKFNWAEHLAQLHCPDGHSEGMFTTESILAILPLSLYVRLIGLPYQIPLLDEYLSDPTTRHMLIKDLPEILGCHISHHKRNLPSLIDTLSLLARMNLVTPTTKAPFNCAKEIVCHLKKKATLVDTRTSLPGYCEVTHPGGNQFPEIIHQFSSLSDVTDYWSSLRDICLSTHLGAKAKAKAKPKTKAKHWVKERERGIFKSYIKETEDLYENIKPLGDGLGAAGLDSSIFSHLRRNWAWTNIGKEKHCSVVVDDMTTCNEDWQLCFTTTTVPGNTLSKHTGGKAAKRKLTPPAEIAAKKVRVLPKNAQRNERLYQSTPGSSADMVSTVKKVKPPRKAKVNKKIRRHAKEALKRAHWSKKHHDERDLAAQKRKEMLRVTFTPQEQKLLFICTLALRILGKKSTDTGYTDWLWTRDILYKDNFESAKAKTALSISRKYRTIMKDPQTKINLNICTADCKQEKEFQQFCNLGKSCEEATFVELVELLKRKYSMENMKTTPLCLPRSLKAFQRQNNIQINIHSSKPLDADEDIVSLKPPVSTLLDIRQGILRDSIVSALLSKNEKYDPIVAYVFLDQFAEEELSLAISDLKKNKVVTQALLHCGVGKSISPTSFSQKISTTGQRILDAHFLPSVAHEAICFYHQLKQNHSLSHNCGKNAPTTVQHATITLSEDFHGGRVLSLFTLLAAGKLSVKIEFPENILHVELEGEKENVEDVPIDENSSQPKDTKKKTQEEKELVLVSNMPHSSEVSPSTTLKEKDNPELIIQDTDMEESRMLTGERETLPNPANVVVQSEAYNVVNNSVLQTSSGAESFNQPSTSVKTVSNEKQQPKSIVVQGTVAKGCRFNQNISRTFSDLLSGIEDHLFGDFGQSRNVPKYKVELQSSSAFSCCLTTSHVGSVRQMGENGFKVKKLGGPVTNIICDSYNKQVLPVRMAGTFIRPLIKTYPCTIKVSLLTHAEKEAIQREHKESMELVDEYFKINADKLPKELDEVLRVSSKEFCFADKDCQALATVYKSIESAKETGVSMKRLEVMVKQSSDLSNFSLAGLIKVLLSFRLVYEVGLLEVCFVTHIFKKHWALPPQCIEAPSSHRKNITDKEQTMSLNEPQASNLHTSVSNPCCDRVQKDSNLSDDKVQSKSSVNQSSRKEKKSSGTQTPQSSPISRPWFCMDGQINKIAYNTFHESVLRYIMRYPGIEKYAIAKHFVNLIFPVTLDCILKTLEVNKCILRCSIMKSCATLFSSTAESNSTTGSTTTYFLPTVDAIIKLADRVFL